MKNYIGTKIDVNDSHIQRGKKCSVSRCPINLAIQEQLNVESSTFNTYFSLVEENDDFGYFYLSKDAENFICSFDNGYPVQPFSFIIEKTVY